MSIIKTDISINPHMIYMRVFNYKKINYISNFFSVNSRMKEF
jgi:hypothetical protein